MYYKNELYSEAEEQGRLRIMNDLTASKAAKRLGDLNRRLNIVRNIIQDSNSTWSKEYWTRVESYLLRNIKNLNRELGAV